MCYVALQAASRAPSPLRAAVSAVSTEGALARVVATAVMDEPPWPVGVQCPSCETTVTPLTGWCSYCMEPLPADGTADEQPLAPVIAGPWLAPPPPIAAVVANFRFRLLAGLIDASVAVPGLVALAFNPAVGVVLLVLAVMVAAFQILWLRPRWGRTVGEQILTLTTSGRKETFRRR